MLKEFREFAVRGNMVDLAIGVIIGAAFNGIVQSLVGDLFMPIIGALTGGVDFSNYFTPLSAKVSAPTLAEAKKEGAVLAWGSFLTVRSISCWSPGRCSSRSSSSIALRRTEAAKAADGAHAAGGPARRNSRPAEGSGPAPSRVTTGKTASWHGTSNGCPLPPKRLCCCRQKEPPARSMFSPSEHWSQEARPCLATIFHLTDGDHVLDDPDGLELPGEAAAREEAILVTDDLKQRLKPRDWTGWVVSIRDEQGNQVEMCR